MDQKSHTTTTKKDLTQSPITTTKVSISPRKQSMSSEAIKSIFKDYIKEQNKAKL